MVGWIRCLPVWDLSNDKQDLVLHNVEPAFAPVMGIKVCGNFIRAVPELPVKEEE